MKISSLLVGTKKLAHSTNFVWPGLVFGTLEVKCNRSPTYTSMVKKIRALKQTSFNHGDTQIQGVAVLRLGTNRVNLSTSFISKRACLADVEASPRVSPSELAGVG